MSSVGKCDICTAGTVTPVVVIHHTGGPGPKVTVCSICYGLGILTRPGGARPVTLADLSRAVRLLREGKR